MDIFYTTGAALLGRKRSLLLLSIKIKPNSPDTNSWVMKSINFVLNGKRGISYPIDGFGILSHVW